jgi:hypothetical protein
LSEAKSTLTLALVHQWCVRNRLLFAMREND